MPMRNAMRRIQTSIFGIQRPERGQRMKLNFSKCEDNFNDAKTNVNQNMHLQDGGVSHGETFT